MAPPVFPTLTGIGWPVVRTPLWSTLRNPVVSGKETTMPLWSFPKYQYELTIDFVRQGAILGNATAFMEYQNLIGFVNICGGTAYPFYYEDPNDSEVSGQVIGVGNGQNRDFQLIRAMGGFVEPIQSPNQSKTTVITANGAPTTAFSYLPGGIIRFNVAPVNGAVIAWSGFYYWLCRFDDDAGCSLSQFMNGLFEVKKLAFTTVKL